MGKLDERHLSKTEEWRPCFGRDDTSKESASQRRERKVCWSEGFSSLKTQWRERARLLRTFPGLFMADTGENVRATSEGISVLSFGS